MKVGSVVWAKLKGYPFWPGRVCTLDEVKDPAVRKILSRPRVANSQLIFFFGSYNYAWIPQTLIEDYVGSYEVHSEDKIASKQKNFKMGLEDAKEWLAHGFLPEIPSSVGEENPIRVTVKMEKSSAEEEAEGDLGEGGREEGEEEQEGGEQQQQEGEGERGEQSEKGEGEERQSTEMRETKRQLEEETPLKEVKRPRKERNGREEETNPPNGNSSPPPPPLVQVGPVLTEELIYKAENLLIRHPISKYHKMEIIKDPPSPKGKVECKAHLSEVRKSSQYECYSIVGSLPYLMEIAAQCVLLPFSRENQVMTTESLQVNTLHTPSQGSAITIAAELMSSEGNLWHLQATVREKGVLMARAFFTKRLSISIPSDTPSSPPQLLQSPPIHSSPFNPRFSL